MGDSRADNHWDFEREEKALAKREQIRAAQEALVSGISRVTNNTDNDPIVHTNRFGDKPSKPAETDAERKRRLYNEQRTLSASDMSKFPTTAKYWGLRPETMSYSSESYDRGGGYDSNSMTYWTISLFDSDEALEAWVLERVERRETYKIIRAEPVNTQVKAVFSIQK